jgi:hypothetical protein
MNVIVVYDRGIRVFSLFLSSPNVDCVIMRYIVGQYRLTKLDESSKVYLLIGYGVIAVGIVGIAVTDCNSDEANGNGWREATK